MIIEKRCDICYGSGGLGLTMGSPLMCYNCGGTGIFLEEYKNEDMRYDVFMKKVGNLLYMHTIEGRISDEAGQLIYDEIYVMVEDKGLVDIGDYYKVKGLDSDE